MPADQIRNRTVGCKMTDSEAERLTAVAEGDGMTLGEWVREVLLERADGLGLLPSVRREVYMILRNEEERHVEEEAQRSGDDRGVEAVGSGVNSGRCGAGVGRVEAHHLRVEGEVWRAGRQPGATVAAATREVHLKLPSRASGQAGLLLK